MSFQPTSPLQESVSRMTIGGVLASRAREAADAPFIYFGDERITYGQIQRRAENASTGLQRMGIGHGDRIAIASANSPDWIVAYFAASRIGAVLVTLNVAYREREFVYMLGQSGARLLICDEHAGHFAFRPFLEDLRPKIPTVENVVFLGDPSASDSWQSLVADGAPDTPDAEARQSGATGPSSCDPGADIDPDSPSVILYTSGTTGDPKGATLTHRSMLASAAAQAERFEQTADDVILGVLPFNHVGGLTCTIIASIVSCGAIALLPRFHPDLVVQAVPARRVTMFVGVPTMYRMTLASEAFADCDASSVRLCVVGGSNVEPELAAQIRERFDGPRLANLYGLSETSGASIISPAEDSLDQVSATIGTPLAGFDTRIVDDDGVLLATGEVGELEVHGACVAAGYWDAPDATAAAFADDGWLATGDVATMSDDGHVTLLARKKEMYVRGGFNVYPAEVENVLTADPAVAMCAVIGVPDPTFGETGHAFVVPVADMPIDAEALVALCRRSLAEYKVPARIEVVDSLPTTPAGKIRKIQLKPN